jgi:hypothetical protein
MRGASRIYRTFLIRLPVRLAQHQLPVHPGAIQWPQIAKLGLALTGGLLSVPFWLAPLHSQPTQQDRQEQLAKLKREHNRSADSIQAELQKLFPKGSPVSTWLISMQRAGAKCQAGTPRPELPPGHGRIWCLQIIKRPESSGTAWYIPVDFDAERKITKLEVYSNPNDD